MTSSNLDMLSKQLNKLENYITKYIYKKYIEIDKPGDKLDEDLNYIYSKKPTNPIEYKLYKDSIFGKHRKCIIKQDEQLKDDLKKMKQADSDYNKKSLLFKKSKKTGYPDSKRCSYIRKYKNKLIRCKNSIINDDEDICFQHQYSPNIYYDSYTELLKKIDTTI